MSAASRHTDIASEATPLISDTAPPELESHLWTHSASPKAGQDRFEIISQTDRILVLIGVLIIGWSFGLDGLVRTTYQSYAASEFGAHSLIATINVLRSVIAASAYPPAAKVADVVGRLELTAISVVLYTVGTAIQSISTSVAYFTCGAVLYQIGYTAIVLVTEVIVADITSMRSRVIFSYTPAVPFVFNTWVSGAFTSAVMTNATWRWGIGMWCIIYPVSAIPLVVSLYKAGFYGAWDDHGTGAGKPCTRKILANALHRLDIVGISLAATAFALILVPLTTAEGHLSKWQSPKTLAPLSLGCLCIYAFIYWETRCAQVPLMPKYLLRDRGVIAALAVRCFLNVTWAIQGNYLFTVLIVAFDFSVTLSTQITAFFTFFGVLSGLVVGLIIYRLRRLKAFIISGTILFAITFALLIRYNSGTSSVAQHGMLGAQVLIGVAAGFCAYPTQALVQSSSRREHVSAMTGIYLATFNIGSALGACISGIIWSQVLPPTLEANLSFQSDSNLAQSIYKAPFEVVPSYPVGTPIRSAIISSYGTVQMLLNTYALALCVPMVACAMWLSNPDLSATQEQDELDVGGTNHQA